MTSAVCNPRTRSTVFLSDGLAGGRKLACSKEVDGCSRCKREGIKCIYSAQKRMGRPRKHRTVEAADPAPAAVAAPVEAPTKVAPPITTIPDFEFDSTIAMDLDFSFLDMNNMDMNFLELVDPNTQFPPAPEQIGLDQGTTVYEKLPPAPPPPLQHQQQQQHPGPFWPLSGNLADINFDEPDPSSAHQPAPEMTPEEVAHLLSPDLAETLPSLSPPSTSSPSTYASPAESDGTRTCSCLSALYLALDSLQSLPKEVGAALKVARTASKTAHDKILCPVCGDPPVELCKPYIPALQSMMMLGALLPSLSNAYMRILTMVDAEAAAADADRRKIKFTIEGYGGLWGWMAKMDPSRCGAADRFEGALFEPILWRLTVRALLKVDVYGINSLTPGIEEEEEANQPGLKDIINMMEERSRRRHLHLDELVASGVEIKTPCVYIPLTSTGEKPTCMRIIDIAKRSMDDLVIP